MAAGVCWPGVSEAIAAGRLHARLISNMNIKRKLNGRECIFSRLEGLTCTIIYL
jgi:hypothetical protein